MDTITEVANLLKEGPASAGNIISETKDYPRRISVDYNINYGFKMASRHTHIQYEFLYIKQGRVTIENNGSRITVSAPCMIIHKPFTLHRAFTDGNMTYERYVINFDESLLTDFSHWVKKLYAITTNSISILSPDELYCDVFSKLCEYVDHAIRDRKYRRAELILALLIDFVCEASKDSMTYSNSIENKYVSQAMSYIGQHYSENILIDDLAKRLFVSRAKLISDFKKYNGITIKQYIQLTRINYAKQMLLSGRSITDTAQRCGFCDDSHFVYTFRKLVGVTPKIFLQNPDNNREIN